MDTKIVKLNGVEVPFVLHTIPKGTAKGNVYMQPRIEALDDGSLVALLGGSAMLRKLASRFLNPKALSVTEEAKGEDGVFNEVKWEALVSNLLTAATGQTKAELEAELAEVEDEMNDFILDPALAQMAMPDMLAKLQEFTQRKMALADAIDAKSKKRVASTAEVAPTAA